MMNFMMSDATKAATETPYVLPEDKRLELQTAIFTRLEYFDGLYHPETTAINMMLDRWAKANGDLIRLFEQSPFYNGNFQIVFPADYTREIDYCTVNEYLKNFYDYCLEMINKMPEVRFGEYTLSEAFDALTKIVTKLNILRQCEENQIPVDQSFRQMLKEDESYMRQIYNHLSYKANSSDYVERRGKAYRREDYDAWMYWRGVGRYLFDNSNRITQTVSEEAAIFFATGYPGALTGKNKSERTIATTGQKLSRVINRMARETGFDKTPEGDNEHFAAFANAINPLNVKRWTVLSIHPLDFYNMSNGNSWRSCHTLDKRNKDRVDNDHNYQGCYAGGPGSYMEDGTTFVYYTVMPDENKEGVHLELSHKASRCMFHLGNNVLVQGRMYPQGTDGKTDKYKEAREIVQRIIAECLGVPNLWVNKKGIDECRKVVTSLGCHYRDYEQFDDCNVSYLKKGDEVIQKNPPKIIVGALHTCPSCGRIHNKQDNVECESCNGISGSASRRERSRQQFLGNYNQGNGDYICADCGRIIDAEDAHEIDGEYYCEECCFYCDYHEQWERGDRVYVQNTGVNICESAYDYSCDYARCEHCDAIFDTRESDTVVIHGRWSDTYYCCPDCAERDDYVECNDGEWRHRENCVYCDHCNAYMDADNGDYISTDDGTIFCSEYCARRGGYAKCADGEWRPRMDCEQCEDDHEYYLRREMIQTPDGHWFRDWDAAERHGYHEQNTEVDEGVA